jgi:phenylalanyl-tRNA synthetase alpha chain
MTSSEKLTEKTIGELGVTQPTQLAQLFVELRAEFKADLVRASQTGGWQSVYERWFGKEPNTSSKIRDNWIRTAPDSWKTLIESLHHEFIEWGFQVSTVNQTLAELSVTRADQVESQFQKLKHIFDSEIKLPANDTILNISHIIWLGRTSGLLSLVRENWLKRASEVLKPSVGVEFNRFKSHLESCFAARKTAILAGAEELVRERVDLSLPGVIRPIGSHHLIRQVFQEIEDIFVAIGFSVVEGPEIETPYYNFEALNIPEFHPVRDDMDTFYIELPKGAPTPLLLRTHTSPMQIRTMEQQKPPVRVIVPGKVYRRDNPDATHSFMFHQVEGLAVDSDITFCDFTGTIEYFVKQFFGPSVKTRFRPSYFPFTEPSVEFDVSCPFCGGTGSSNGSTCSKCKGAAWIELFGAGMVDPAVYGFVNYDAKKVSGFAFGIGIDRLAMLKYGIDDIQVFFQNDVRFLRQFP